ncbi:MAG: bifunctional 5,10-methylenetetrahydrofolate dehydrogenase/5,10-methenyltetrahydrofolate cyclohydrolase [Oligoflexia bacterium]|nr:bifunctional 5,10-methylenetetrahydrofolate dehydrogenase/5,10-methenyltetrahydrofolate cyclohydrolase [Oligoflexia bacterium]
MFTLIDGRKIAQDIREELKKEVEELGIKPGLAVIMVGEDPASAVYVRNKGIACEKAGFYHETHNLTEHTSEQELVGLINDLAARADIHGILVQLPLPRHIRENVIINTIPPVKDVDCFHPMNLGKLFAKKKGDAPLDIVPCTPAACIELLDRYEISLSGKNVVVVGRSNIVGKPLSLMMLDRDATITICHSKTGDMENKLKEADILVAAVGVRHLVKSHMVKEGAVVIDVGMNRDENGKLAGDVDFESVKDKTQAITPVPRGVGPMTIAMLLKNTMKMAKKANNL